MRNWHGNLPPFGSWHTGRRVFNPLSLFANGEPGVWYDPSDLTTMFTDTAGTTQAAVGQAVALMLDKSKGLALGPELVTNGDFSNGTTGWTAFQFATLSVSDGVLRVTNIGGNFGQAGSSFIPTIGKTYEVSATLVAVTSGRVGRLAFGGVTLSSSIAVGTHTYITTAVSANSLRLFSSSAYAAEWSEWDNISVRELPGNHATQAVLSARPILGRVPASGRRNLLERTEELGNPYWSRTNITLGTGIADPNGGTAAFTFTASAANATVSRSIGSLAAGGTISCFIRRRTGTGAVALWDGNSYVNVTFASDWVRVNVPQGVNSTGFFDIRISTSGDAVDIAFPQVEAGALSPYQRVGAETDITEAGKADLYHLVFDGTDDWLVTPTITPGTDKAQVFAGVRKLGVVDASLIGSSSAPLTQQGTFEIRAPRNLSTSDDYAWFSHGTTTGGTRSAGFAAPITNVLTGIGDISGDNATLRVDGTQAAQNTSDQGTGNYLAYPLYIGRRAGTSLPFNGHLYSLVVRFGANLDAGTISATERYVGGKTGVVLP